MSKEPTFLPWRDPERIDTLLTMVETFWKIHSDLRFGQLVSLIIGGRDIFYMEDDLFMEYITEFLEAENE